ncbi:MAG: 30S ribosomal protein S12 methylthiotransferase RimO [Bacteroidales bacterium]
MKRVNLVTLGCSKNLVDSERMALQFEKAGYEVLFDANEPSEWVIINTCGFILDAKQESLDMIFEFVEAKQRGEIEKIAVVGCLSERYKHDLPQELPEVDVWHGTYQYDKLLEDLSIPVTEDYHSNRLVANPSKHFAYLKVSDGCNRACSYCAIPLIKGRLQSVEVSVLVEEAKALAAQGVKELILIAQDLSDYGKDLSKTHTLLSLLQELVKIDTIEWIRLHYAYPTNFPDSVIAFIRDNPKVCKYLDVPVQHISDSVLSQMHRGQTAKATRDFLQKLRKEIPGIAIRTTLLVGFPGETEEDFAALLDFVQEFRFERLGVFPYSEEEGTYAARHLNDDIPEAVKQLRANEVMEVQEGISQEINESRIGAEERVLIDRQQGNYFVARSQFDSPEVDNEIYLPVDERFGPGDFVQVRITGATAFDLQAEYR